MAQQGRMNARFSSGSIVKRLFEGIKDLCKIVTLKVDAEGWNIRAYDESHIAHVHMRLSPEAFERYECTKTLDIGIHVHQVNKILRLCDPSDALIMSYTEDSDVFMFRIEKDASARVVEFEMRLIEHDNQNQTSPFADDALSPDYLELPAAEFQRITRDLQVFSNDLEIQAKPNIVTFNAKGEFGAASINLKSSGKDSNGPGVSIQLSRAYDQVFSIRFCHSFAKAASCNTYCRIHFSDNSKAMVVHYKIDSTSEDDVKKDPNSPIDVNANAAARFKDQGVGQLQFYLCPKGGPF